MRYALVCCLALLETAAVCAAASQTEEQGKLVLENEHVRAAVDPAKGAALISLVTKPDGNERLAGASFVDSNVLPARRLQGLGELTFKVNKETRMGDAQEAVWELSARLPEETPIDFWYHLVGRMGEAITYNPPAVLEWPRPYENLELVKRYRLRSGSSALTVEYEVTNAGDKAVELCLATTHAFAGAKLCVPTRDGAASFDIPLTDRAQYPCFQYSATAWFYDVPAAWVATFGEDRTGIVGCFDPRHVSCLRPDVDSGQVLLVRTRVRIEPGATFKTSGWLMPVHGLPRIDGARAGICASFQVSPTRADVEPPIVRRELAQNIQAKLAQLDLSLKPDTTEKDDLTPDKEEDAGDPFDRPDLTEDQIEAELEGTDLTKKVKTKYEGKPIQVRIALLAAKERNVEVVFRTKRNPWGEWQELGTQTAKLTVGKPASLELTLEPKTMGTYLVQAEVREGGKPVERFERPVVAGHRSGYFMPAPPSPEGEVNREFYYRHVAGWPMWPYEVGYQPSMEYETSHFDYACPPAGGPVKALIITPFQRCREVVELKQRMDIDFDCVVTGVRGFGLRGRAKIDEIDLCRTALNKPHEVIVLPIFYGQYLTADLVEEIARQVKEDGVGLVFSLAEELLGPFAEFNQHAKKDERCPDKFRRCEFGRGRVVFRDGHCQELFTNWLSESAHDTNEDEFSNFMKMFMWAARGEPALSVTAVEPLPKSKIDRQKLADLTLRFEVSNRTDKPFRGKLRVVTHQDLLADYPFYPQAEMLRCHRVVREWEARDRDETEFSVGGKATAVVELPAPDIPNGNFRLDTFVLDASGATVTWERFPITVRSETDIVAVQLISGVRDPREISFKTANMWDLQFCAQPDATVELAFRLSKAEKVNRVSLVATDPWDRVLANLEQRLEPGPAGRSVKFAVPLRACLHRVMVISMRAYDAGGCIRDRRISGFVYPRPERVPLYQFRAYANASEIDRRMTGYDARVGACPLSRAHLHAWCNLSIQAWLGGPPTCDRITIPGEKIEKLPELDLLGALLQSGGPGGGAGAGDAPAKPGEETAAGTPDDAPIASGDDIGVSMLIEPGETKEEAEADPLEESLEKEEEGPVDPKDGWVRIPCLNNPKLRQGMLNGIRGLYRAQSLFGPFSGGMGDEWYVTYEGRLQDKHNPWRRSFVPGKDTNSCRCEHCLRLFKEYAKNLFGADLTALNREWNTEFKTWEEVDRPIVNETVKDNEAPPESMWAYVLDHRRFDDVRVGLFLKQAKEVVKGLDPQNRIGWGDVFKTSIWSGLDMYLMSQQCDNNQLDRDQVKWASFGSPTNAHWVGYQKKYSKIRENFTAWWMMLWGNTAVTYYGKGDYPMHRPDFSFFDACKEMFRSMREIRERGYDRLLVGHRQMDPVAIHYDPTSIYVAHLEDWTEDPQRFARAMGCGGRSYNEFCHQVEQTYEGLLASRGFQHFATAYAQLADGHFGRYGTPKLLLLPYTQCVSKKQAATLEKFVKEGGVLVGDIRSGARNGHGRALESGTLDHVFGIKRRAGKYPMRVRADKDGESIPVRFSEGFEEPFAMTFGAVGPGDVVADTAKALASYELDGEQQPAFLVNALGKGKSIYLNFMPTGYRIVKDEGLSDEQEVDERVLRGLAAQRFRQVFQKFVDYADLQVPAECPGLMKFRFADGKLTYVCLGAGYKNNPAVWRTPHEVTLREKQHVYDSRRGKYLGFTDRFDAEFSIPDKLFALVYSLMPYKVEGIEIKPQQESVKPGETLRFEARLQPAETQQQRHVLWLRVIDPRGEDIYWYGAVIETKDGVAKGRVDLALNDRPGQWKMVLTDTATGTHVEREFVVK